MYDSLTRGTLYEAASLGDDCHFDRVSDVVLEVVAAELSGEFEDARLCARPDWPGGGEGADEIEDAVTVVAEGANGEEFAEGGAGCGERTDCHVVLVANEVGPVEEKGKHDGPVSRALDRVVLVLEGADEGVGKVGCGELRVGETGEKKGDRTDRFKGEGCICKEVGNETDKRRETDRCSAAEGVGGVSERADGESTHDDVLWGGERRTGRGRGRGCD